MSCLFEGRFCFISSVSSLQNVSAWINFHDKIQKIHDLGLEIWLMFEALRSVSSGSSLPRENIRAPYYVCNALCVT